MTKDILNTWLKAQALIAKMETMKTQNTIAAIRGEYPYEPDFTHIENQLEKLQLPADPPPTKPDIIKNLSGHLSDEQGIEALKGKVPEEGKCPFCKAEKIIKARGDELYEQCSSDPAHYSEYLGTNSELDD